MYMTSSLSGCIVVRCATKSSKRVFPYSAISPVFSQLTLGHSLGAYPAPVGTVRLCFFGFQKILSAISAKSAEGKDFPNLPKKRRLALGSGAHSRRFAQECPEGNPGKYKQGETQWHSTKTNRN
jgi:hypothetical protein